jgi:riboflavin transporter FmnP
MARANSRPFQISLVASMLALTAILELINRALPLRVPWGMSIDFVAVPVMLVFFILGMRYALAASVGMFAILMIIGFAGFVGAVMKFGATVAMLLVLGVLSTPLRNKPNPALTYKNPLKFGLASALALGARVVVAAFLNYYWALPLFFAMPVEQIIQTFFFGSILGFVAFVAVLNITQGIIDLAVSWVVTFGLGLENRFGPINQQIAPKAQ